MIGDTSSTEYVIQINEPDDKSCAAGSHQSNNPFMTISKGDILSSAMLNLNDESPMLEVTKVTHMIFQTANSPLTHKIVYDTKVAKVN